LHTLHGDMGTRKNSAATAHSALCAGSNQNSVSICKQKKESLVLISPSTVIELKLLSTEIFKDSCKIALSTKASVVINTNIV